MRELKAETIVPQGTTITLQMYPKSEADKLLAELEESHKMEVDQLLMTILELKEELEAPQLVMRLNTTEALYSNLDTMGRLNHKIYVVERRELHQKYKRCLAMARWCEERICRIERDYAFWQYGKDYAQNFYKKWKLRWLKLAEKLKKTK